MNCTLSIYPVTDRKKFIEVVEIANKTKNANFQIVACDQGFEIEYERPQQLFMLGRMYQPYKPAKDPGTSFVLRYNNDYLNNI